MAIVLTVATLRFVTQQASPPPPVGQGLQISSFRDGTQTHHTC